MKDRVGLCDNGDLDEVVMRNCDVHLERMDTGVIWVGLYPRGKKRAGTRRTIWLPS